MPYNAEPGEVAYVVASKLINHGDVVVDQGFCGEAVKTVTPAADVARALRAQIAVGEAYTLLISKVVEVPLANLPSPTKGTLIYINTTTNALGTVATGSIPLGKVASLPSERGTPADKVRINLRLKV